MEIKRPPSFSLSLVFPAYDEEKNLRPIVEKAIAVLQRLGVEDYEVIIVNDGSKDKTGEIADQMGVENPRIRAIHHPKNQGYGVALRSGFQAAKKQRVFYTDADIQFDLSEIERIFALTPYADIVTGFRVRKQYNLYRLTVSTSFNLIVKLLFGLADHDINCSFKLYPRELFDRITLESRHYFIDGEIAVKARALGYTTVQAGVTHYPRAQGFSNAVLPQFSLYTIWEILRAWLKFRKNRFK